ncbi:MAG: YbaB/EbfC family nucleoid-associated protein [Anaerolineae bacterium]|nr:YbaB/EbfC family nucleoid-associated protein [Anaerolineae bacterium]MDK1118556.1 YbaB/EbfC family nucleoid-associated protein [Anaerolineae bacterium]
MSKETENPTGEDQQKGMLAQLKRMQQKLAETQAGLENETVTVTTGGGAVTVTMTGVQKCHEVIIDPELLKDADAEKVQELVRSAVNLALDKSRQLAEKRLGPLAGGLPF